MTTVHSNLNEVEFAKICNDNEQYGGTLGEAMEIEMEKLERVQMNDQMIIWNDLKQEILDKIDIIDRETLWREFEPRWWLEMMEVRRIVGK